MCYLCGKVKPYQYPHTGMCDTVRIGDGTSIMYYVMWCDTIYEVNPSADWQSLTEYPPFESEYFIKKSVDGHQFEHDARKWHEWYTRKSDDIEY